MKLKACVFSGILLFCVIFTAVYGSAKISEKNEFTYPVDFKGIITLWQIDTFEGGINSRKQFLMSASREFEKQNKGTLIMVISHTAESAKNAYDLGETPDLISFGAGVRVNNAKILGKDINKFVSTYEKDFRLGGKVGDGLYAVAWCRGNYVLIINKKLVAEPSKKLENLLVSMGEFTQPLTSLIMAGYTAENVTVMTPMDAYVKFTEGKTPYFLATQRDVVRLTGRGMEFDMIALNKYNDLYQYISVTSEDAQKSVFAERFVRYLLSEKVQKKLNMISMCSPYFKVEFDSERLVCLQKENSLRTVSAFCAPEVLKEMQEVAVHAVKGDQTALTKIKNYIL